MINTLGIVNQANVFRFITSPNSNTLEGASRLADPQQKCTHGCLQEACRSGFGDVGSFGVGKCLGRICTTRGDFQEGSAEHTLRHRQCRVLDAGANAFCDGDGRSLTVARCVSVRGAQTSDSCVSGCCVL